MPMSHLKVALRNLNKYKGHAFLNVFGLALGIACSVLILIWVLDELGFDRFHRKTDRLFRVEQDQTTAQGIFHVSSMPPGLAPALKAEILEIREAARFDGNATLLLRAGERSCYEERALSVDPAFLRMFSFPFAQGDAERALDNPSGMVISRELAARLFGNENPMGKAFTVNENLPYVVTGVLDALPDNSSIQFNLLQSAICLYIHDHSRIRPSHRLHQFHEHVNRPVCQPGQGSGLER